MGNMGCYVIKHCTMGCYRRCSRIDSTAAGCDGIIHSDEKRKEVEENSRRTNGSPLPAPTD